MAKGIVGRARATGAKRFLSSDAQRTIFYLMIVVFLVASIRESVEAGFSPSRLARQLFGGLAAALLLMLLAGPAPKAAAGLAMIGALGVLLANSDVISDFAGRTVATGGRTRGPQNPGGGQPPGAVV